jgi:hypothetical protein
MFQIDDNDDDVMYDFLGHYIIYDENQKINDPDIFCTLFRNSIVLIISAIAYYFYYIDNL